MFVGFLRENAIASYSLTVGFWATSYYVCKILKRKCIASF
jgi:hypothetical protein